MLFDINHHSNKQVIFVPVLSNIAYYCGFIIQTFDFIACSSIACVTCST